jgi:hypothetical protein
MKVSVTYAAFMILATISIFAVFYSLAVADQDQKKPVQVSLNCNDVRAAVKTVGLEVAERTARAAGISERQIREAHRCLMPSNR